MASPKLARNRAAGTGSLWSGTRFHGAGKSIQDFFAISGNSPFTVSE